MRFTISSEQLKFFHTEGYLTLENLLAQEERTALLSTIETICQKSPGYPEENFFRSIPLVTSLTRKRGWGEIVYTLIQKKPLSIAHDLLFRQVPSSAYLLEEDTCGLLIDLNTCGGCFFKNQLPIATLYNSSITCYFLLVFTAKRLPEQINPIIIR
jgi:hypothetical protein